MTIVFNEEKRRYECKTDLALCYTVSGEGEDEEPISREDFINILTLKRVEFNADGITFWYDDGDLFWGHTVMVDSSADGTPRYAQMLGGS